MKISVKLISVCLVFAFLVSAMFSLASCKKKDEAPKETDPIEIVDAIADPDAKKAIIILPGITGSELCAGEDYNTIIDSTIAKGDTVWVPKELYTTINSFSSGKFDLSSFNTEGLVNFTYSMMMLENNEDGTSKYNVVAKEVSENDEIIGTLATYNMLYDELKVKFSEYYDVIFYSYDWRMPTQNIAAELESFVNENEYDSVTLVCHSMGGIVAAQYLALNESNVEKTDKLITLGTPYGGSAKALMALQQGRYFNVSFADAPIRELVYNMTSLYELLPTVNNIENQGGYIYDDGVLLGVEESESFVKFDVKPDTEDSIGLNDALYNDAVLAHSDLYKSGDHIINNKDLDVYMIAGYNSETVIDIYEENDIISELGFTDFGDGTVSCESACYFNGELYDNPIYYINGVDHQGLVKDANTIQLVVALLAKGNDVEETDYNTKVITDLSPAADFANEERTKKSIDSISLEIPISITKK